MHDDLTPVFEECGKPEPNLSALEIGYGGKSSTYILLLEKFNSLTMDEELWWIM